MVLQGRLGLWPWLSSLAGEGVRRSHQNGRKFYGSHFSGYRGCGEPLIRFDCVPTGAWGIRKDGNKKEHVTKPFTYPELRARIKAVLRRRESRRDGPSRVGDLTIDPVRRRVAVGDREVALAKKEFTLLRALATDPTRVFSKEELLREVWGFRSPGRTRTLDSHASRLRRKLDPEHSRYVINCWGDRR
jgi:hypothetical protein